jgi:hypothetical protein
MEQRLEVQNRVQRQGDFMDNSNRFQWVFLLVQSAGTGSISEIWREVAGSCSNYEGEEPESIPTE